MNAAIQAEEVLLIVVRGNLNGMSAKYNKK